MKKSRFSEVQIIGVLPKAPDAPNTATLKMRDPWSEGLDCDNEVTGFVNSRFERFGGRYSLDCDLPGRQIDLHLCAGILFANSLSHCRYAVLAIHAFYLKFDRHQFPFHEVALRR
jgi:hypothetical protein